jgi:hypothetical protein
VDDEHSEWHANDYGDGHGDNYKGEVIERSAKNFGAVLDEKGPLTHGALVLVLVRELILVIIRGLRE